MKLRFILPWAMLSLLAFAEEPLVKPRIYGEVSFVSGGIGGDERSAMQAIRANYNLSLLFSVASSGEFLSDVKVSIKDASGNTLMETVADGPLFFAQLKPGRYIVSADRDGQVIEKTANVGGKQQASLSFAWPRRRGD